MRSSKKGPFVDERLTKKVAAMKLSGKKEPIKTWSRSSQISPDFVGSTFSIHNGKKFIDVFINEAMVGHRLGEFSPTRVFRGHGKMVKRLVTKT